MSEISQFYALRNKLLVLWEKLDTSGYAVADSKGRLMQRPTSKVRVRPKREFRLEP